MQTSEQFRAAAERLRAYRVDAPTRRPALTYRAPVSVKRPGVRRATTVPRVAPDLDVATLSGAAALVARGLVSSVELVRDAYRAIAAWEPTVHAFEYLRPEADALREAAERDASRPPASLTPAPLWGVPVTVKDVIHVAGMPTTGSSRTLPDYVPTADAAAVGLLRRAGAIVLGKTTTHEYALGVTTPQSRNPWDPTRDPGGSSGGSAIAVATGMGLGSLGTDTRASIRVPAALCGTVGFKATFGLVSTEGVLTLSWTMDHVAPMARTVADVALLLNVLVEHDPRDPGSVARPAEDYTRHAHPAVAGLRVGVPQDALRGAAPSVLGVFEQALDALRYRGAEVVPVDAPDVADFELANAAGLIVSRCEALAFQRTLIGEDGPYTQDVREQLTEAARIPALDYLQAQRYRAALAERMGALLEGLDALALPTSRAVAPPLEESDQYLLVLSENCVPWSFIGFPAVSVPCGVTPERLPVGLELVAAPFDDGVLLTLAAAVEASTSLPPLTPPQA